MAGVFSDSWEMFKFSFKWLQDKDSFRLFIATVLLSISQIFILAFILGWGAYSEIQANPQKFMEILGSIGLWDLILVSIFAIGISILQMWVGIEAFVNAINKIGIKSPRFSASRIWNYILIALASIIASIFSLYDLKLLVIPLVSLLILLLFPSFMGISLIFMIAYMFVVFYNYLRLSLATDIYVVKKGGIRQSLDQSFSSTKGRILKLLS
mgnify:FL=1